MIELGGGLIFSFRYPWVADAAAYGTVLFFLVGVWIGVQEIRTRRLLALRFMVWAAVRWIVLVPLCALALFLALAGPQTFKSEVLGETLHGRVAIAIDTSASQGAGDIPQEIVRAFALRGIVPTRMSLCKEAIAEALRGVEGLEVMVFTFTESVTLRSGDWIRLTSRGRRVWESIWESVETSWIGSGTNLSRALHEMREEAGLEADLALLCSDGGKGGSMETPQTILEKASAFRHIPYPPPHANRFRSMPIYVAGAGMRGSPVPIPVFGPDGTLLSFLREPGTDNLVSTEFDEAILRLVAEESGGEYVLLERLDAARGLLARAVLSSVKKGDGITVTSAKDRSGPFIISATILFFCISNGFARLAGLVRLRQ